MLKSPRRHLSKINSKFRVILDYSLVAFAHPALMKEAAKTVLHRKSRQLASDLQAVNIEKDTTAKTGPVDPKYILDMLGKDTGVLVLYKDDENIHIGLPDTDFLSSLVKLKLSVASGNITYNNKVIRLSSSSERRAALTSPYVIFSFLGPALREVKLRIECYALRTDGVWISGNANNRSARALYSDVLLTPGLHSLAEILPAMTIDTRGAEMPVDVVYTWVNHQDTAWASAYQKYKSATDSETVSDFETHISDDAKAISRFHSIDELRFSLRSVAKNMPWIRKIHVFTNCQVPNWLKNDHPGICWVDHSAVIPEEYLPTFSSHVIESYLHHIPDLAQQFIYLNDDVFISKKLDKDFFFHPNGLSRSFLESYGMVSGTVRIGDPDYLNASRNSSRLITEAFGVVPTRLHQHTAFALRRDVLKEIEERWPIAFHTFRKNRFRMPTDINLTSFLYHHYAINTEKAVDAKINIALIKQLDVRWKNRLAKIPSQNVETICINEGGSGTPSWDWHACVMEFLTETYPIKAKWEK